MSPSLSFLCFFLPFFKFQCASCRALELLISILYATIALAMRVKHFNLKISMVEKYVCVHSVLWTKT